MRSEAMRLEIVSDPGGTRLLVHLAEHEGKALNVGLEAEATAWQATFRDRIREAGLLGSIRQLESSLHASRLELQDLIAHEQTLRAERRKQLEQGAALNGVEKKLAATLTNAGIVKSLITELESLLAARSALAGNEILELHENLMAELYLDQQKQKDEMEAQFLAVAGDLVQKLVKLKKVSESRGLSLQRFRRRISEGTTNELVRQYLAEPAATPAAEPAAAEPGLFHPKQPRREP
jgi:hypothetical protein